MENQRPRLDDPVEYAIIKSIYFKDARPSGEDIDPAEKMDRMEAKIRFNNKSSR